MLYLEQDRMFFLTSTILRIHMSLMYRRRISQIKWFANTLCAVDSKYNIILDRLIFLEEGVLPNLDIAYPHIFRNIH